MRHSGLAKDKVMLKLAAIAGVMLALGTASPLFASAEPLVTTDVEVIKTQIDRDERMTVPVRIGPVGIGAKDLSLIHI